MSNNNGTPAQAPEIKSVKDYVQSQKDLESLGAVHIGNICSGQDVASDVHLPHATYKALCESLGIPDRYIVSEKGAIAAFNKAWHKAYKPKGLKATEAKPKNGQTSDRILIVFYKESTQGTTLSDIELETQHEITLSFHKETHAIEAVPKSGDYIDDAARLISDVRTLWEKYTEITTGDIQSMSAAFCRSLGIPIQPRGGSYFIPRKHDNLVEAMGRLYSEISEKSVFFTVPVYSSPKGNNSIGQAASKSLLGDVDSLDLEVFQMCLDPAGCEKLNRLLSNAIAESTDIDSVRDYLERFQAQVSQALRNEAQSILNALPMSSQQLEDKLGKLKDKIVMKEYRDSTLTGRMGEISDVSQKILDFDEFLGTERDRLMDTLGRLNSYLSIMHSARLGGLSVSTLNDGDSPAGSTVATSEQEEVNTPIDLPSDVPVSVPPLASASTAIAIDSPIPDEIDLSDPDF